MTYEEMFTILRQQKKVVLKTPDANKFMIWLRLKGIAYNASFGLHQYDKMTIEIV